MDENTLLNISQNIQDLTFILTNKNYDRIGALSNVDQNTVVYKKTLHGSEITFEVYKELSNIKERLWNELSDLKLIWVKELNEYFQICVTTDELSYTKKNVTGTSLCEAELSQVNLYNIEINTEDDIARDDYKVTTFYDMDNPDASLIHRILSKVPQYTIKHVDSSLSKIQRSFSIDGTSVLDFLNGECAEQFNCLFTFDSTDRSVSVYDLYTICLDCGERYDMSNFTHIDKNGSLTYTCPKCGSHNVKYYGEDTKIFVDNENLTDEVQLETDTDSVKNCFKLVAGDDLMTATVRLLNMNGSDYIYYISDEQKKDMPKELVNKIESYDKLCVSYTAEYESLISQIYEASDKLYYYKNTMMPMIEHSTVTAATEAAKLTSQNLSPLGLSSVTTSTSKSTIESALKNYAKVYVKIGYVKLEINNSSYSYVGTDASGNNYGTWTGNFKVTNYSDEEDIAYSPTITVKVYDNYQNFVEQKIKKSILNNANDDDSIFDVLSIDNLDNFKNALTYYCMNRLKSFYDAVQTALDVLIQMGQAGQNAELYTTLYTPYYNKLWACQNEIDKRQITIDEWQIKYDASISRQQEIQKALNFENYIGADLYKLFCCYRREDTYQNENYISDGLEDQEIIDRAKEFLEVAKKELVKSATMQHSISTTLYNLLLIPEFKPLLNSFEVGNWIRVRVDDSIYKLRLIDYTISFSSMNTISVNFSDVTKIHDSVSDFESIIKKTQSMASNYSYISKQADAGHKASVNMDRIVEDGLNSALVNIKNNDREETTLTNHGILCREYDDISDSYSDEQLILTHNILGFTDNNRKTVKTSLGKHEYTYFDGNAFVKDEAYGLSCEFVQSGYIYGSQIISGQIYSSNYSPTSGSHLDLNSGEFSFAGGKFTYDTAKDKMTMRGVTIEWSTSTTPEIADISGLTQQLNGIDAYLNQLDDRIQSFSQTNDPSTNWTTTELKNKHKGDLWFNPNNGLTKRWTGTAWETITDSDLETLAKSKAQIFTATPTVPYYVGDLWVQGVNGDILNCITTRTSGSYSASDWSKSSKYTDDTAVTNLDDKVVKILAGQYKTTIGEDYIISPHIGGGDININNRFKVDSLGNVTLPDNATITWGQVTGTGNVANISDIPTNNNQLLNGAGYTTMSDVEGKGYQNATQVTQITKDTVTTSYVNALNVTAGSVAAENITGTTISGKTIVGGTVIGTIISGGSINIGTGFTVDSQGNIKSVSGEFVSATFKNTLFYGLDYNGQTISYPIINVPSQGNVTFGINNMHTTFPGSVQFDSSCICNKAYVTYCNDSNDTAIPNVSWVNGKILTTTPTSDSTSTDKAPSYYACANMIKNIQQWVNDKGYSTSSGIVGIAVSTTTGTLTKNGSGHYFWGAYSGGVLSSCDGVSLKLPDNDPYSDIRVKNSITEMPDISEIYKRIKLYKFKYNQDIVDTDDLWHWGILAQPTEELFNEYGYTLDDFSLIRKNDPNSDLHEDRYVNDQIYRVTSNEFHAMHIQMIQKLCKKTDDQQKEIESLKQQNISLEGRLSILEQIVNQLSSQIN